jgi:regulatory protein
VTQTVGTYEAALQRAGRLIARRPRTESDLRAALTRVGFAPELVERALARLGELGLVDDHAFAEAWVAERARRGLSERALVAELEAKGVPRSIAEVAVGAAALDDGERARALAVAHLERLRGLPPARQAARLQGLLARRGYSAEAVEGAVRAVLPPEGWD